jgi:anti-sigma factor RsiW
MSSPDHRAVAELVTEYLEDAMSPQDRAVFEGHLDGCSECRRELETMRRTIALLGTLREEDVPEATMEYLLGVYREILRAPEGGPA